MDRLKLLSQRTFLKGFKKEKLNAMLCSKAKKIILPAIILSALQLLLLIFSSTSSSIVQGSKHDLTFLTGSGNFSAVENGEDEICIFCHTPHNAIVADADGNRLPLWNRSISGLDAATFSLYRSATFNAGVLETDAQRQPTGMSLVCLSCHDGVTAINVLQNYGRQAPIMTGVPADMNSGYDQIQDIWGSGGANIGGAYAANPNIRDLSDDHPVSITYNAGLVAADNGGLKDPGSISPLRLFNDRLECATCHNPHEQGNAVDGTFPFLRTSNINSAMCLKCHNK